MNKYVPESEVLEVPSRKLQYPEATKIYYNPYTFGDILKINNSNFDTIQLYEFILEGVRVTGMDKRDLTFYDVVYLGWLRKIASLGTPILNVRSYCPNCDGVNNRTIPLQDLDFQDSVVPKLPIKTTISNVELHFNFLTVSDFMEIQKSSKSEDVVYIFSKHVTNVPHSEAYDLIYNSVGLDISKVDRLNEYLYHGLKSIDFKCSSCSHEYLINPSKSTEAEITRPFRGEDSDVGDEISFG